MTARLRLPRHDPALPWTPGGHGPVPALVLCAHGTRDRRGAATVDSLRGAVARTLPGVDVHLAYVDVQEPRVDRVVAELGARGRPVVVVPVLLSLGHHVQVDVAAAVDAGADATSTGALGPDPALADVLRDRVREAGGCTGDAVVVAAAGSSHATSARDAGVVADLLAAGWEGPVTCGFGAKAAPSVADAVEAAREAGARRVVVASYLVGEGFFFDRLRDAGADLVSAPLGADRRIVDLVRRRYLDAASHRLPRAS